jgi:hypothetical protein
MKTTLLTLFSFLLLVQLYAGGLTNFDNKISGDGSYDVYSELLRFGITYRIL